MQTRVTKEIKRFGKRMMMSPVWNPLVFKTLTGFRKASAQLDKLSHRWVPWGEVSVRYGGLDLKLYSEADEGVLVRMLHGMEWEEPDFFTLSVIAKHCGTILDVGANTGIFALGAALSNPDCRIHAFEPFPVNAARMRKNLEINKVSNVTIHPEAVGQKSSKLTLNFPKGNHIEGAISINGNFTSHFSQEDCEAHEVQQVSLDEFVREHSLGDVRAIKLDVEMHELAVLEGARDLLESQKPVVLCEVIFPERMLAEHPELDDVIDHQHHEKIWDFFHSLGYTAYLVTDEGLLKVPSLSASPKSKPNYLFSPKSIEGYLIPIEQLSDRVSELLN